jgi:predicted N-acetyltransferase YhbS
MASPPPPRFGLTFISEARALMSISYRVEPQLSSAEFVDVLRRSSLAERRPVDDARMIADMLRHADVLVTARTDDGLLVGVSRAITDFAYCTYLSDLAVAGEFQRQGIGRELIRRTHEAAGLGTTLILLAAPGAESYYGHIGMTQHRSCWIMRSANTGRPPVDRRKPPWPRRNDQLSSND